MHRVHHQHHKSYGARGGCRGFMNFDPREFGPPGGGFGPGGPRWGRGGRKARRGDIRTAALLLLAEEPRNGYQLMQEIEQRSEGAWRPSPGSVYPALSQLEDEGLIRAEEIDGRKAYRLTVEGLARVEERDASLPAPWEQIGGDGPHEQARELAKTMREVAFAFSQVVRAGSPDQQEQARKALADLRRELYRILGDGDDESTSD